jgi:P27 family predicted phage terminase small subunit
MGSRGPIGKHPDRRQGHRSDPTGAVLPLGAVREPPAPPAGLLAPARAAWACFWASPLAALVTPADVPTLERLFGLYDERDRAWRAYRRRRLVEGSQGQPVASPLFGVVAGLDRQILALEDRFGMSPAARLRLGIRFGQAARTLDDLARELGEETPLERLRREAREAREARGVDFSRFADDPEEPDPRISPA